MALTFETKLFKALELASAQIDSDTLFPGFQPDVQALISAGLAVVSDEMRVVTAHSVQREVRLTDGTNRSMLIRIFVGDTPADARYALMISLDLVMRPMTIRQADPRTELHGDFTLIEEAADGFSFLAVGRGNVVFSLTNEEAASENIWTVMEEMDLQLRCSRRVPPNQLNAHRPVFDHFELTESPVVAGSQAPLALTVRDPFGLPVELNAVADAGTIRRIADTPPRFVYEPNANVGPSRLTAFAINRAGLIAAEYLDVLVTIA